MRIKSFKQFLNEKMNPQPDDSPSLASAKNFYNEQEEIIRNYNSNRVDLDNIYMSYTNREDLINRLNNKGFLDKNTSDPKGIKFKNPYLGKLASISKEKRRLKDLQTIIQGNNKDIETYKQTIADNKGNETVINDTQTKIDNSTERLKSRQEEIKEIEKNIRDLDKQIRDDMDELKSKHEETKKRIRDEESKKMSVPADTSQGESEEPKE